MQTIKVPNTLNDMNLSHLKFFLAVGEMEDNKKLIEDLRPEEASDLNALFFNYELEYFDKFTFTSNLELLSNIIDACQIVKDEDIRPVIEVDGVRYIWQLDYSKQNVSFHRDISRCDFHKRPADLLAFCYIEDGMHYNTIDKVSKVIQNERHARAIALESQFNLAQYVKVHDFFLQSYPVLRLCSLQSQLSKLKSKQPRRKSRK